jgi:hypothetical protein
LDLKQKDRGSYVHAVGNRQDAITLPEGPTEKVEYRYDGSRGVHALQQSVVGNIRLYGFGLRPTSERWAVKENPERVIQATGFKVSKGLDNTTKHRHSELT